MICPNCKVKLTNGSKYCPRCGILFKSDDVERYTKMYNVDLLEMYFKENKVGIHIENISLWYLLFNGFYAMYKKMYSVGIISIISSLVFYFLVASNSIETLIFQSFGFSFYFVVFCLVIPVFIYLYYAFKFNDLLIANKKKRLNKILRKNSHKSEDEIIKIVKKDSENSIKAVLITILVLIVFFLLITDM